MREKIVAALFFGLLACPDCWAGQVVVDVLNSAGEPVQNAVVALSPDAPPPPSAKAPTLPTSAVIDQKDEMFVPLVTLLPQGGQLTFHNSDTTRHHVYSFSQIKQFQFVLNPGQASPPVTFDEGGIAAIGCNIHDHMIAYVYAATSPWTAVSDATGKVQFSAVPQGKAHVEIWHPSLAPGVKPVRLAVDVGSDAKQLSATLRLAVQRAHSPHQMDY